MQAKIYNYHNFIALEGSVPDELERENIPLGAVAVGVFDGVHLGHRKLLRELRLRAEEKNAVLAALTFVPHPRQVLGGDPGRVHLLIPVEERVRLLHEAGADIVLALNFTPEFSRLAPEDFLEKIFQPEKGRIAAIGVGANWRFGFRGAGNVELLEKWGRQCAVNCVAVPEMKIDGEVVSSSAVRRAVGAGNLELAIRMLGRPYALCGVISGGFEVAGKVLKHPTANILVKDGILPPDGVYAASIEVEGLGRAFPAAVNIGVSPTFAYGGAKRRVEAHILGFSGDIYSRRARLCPLHYLRPERAFPDPEALKKQIEKDIDEICSIVKLI